MRRSVSPFHAPGRKRLRNCGLAGLAFFSFAELHAKRARLKDSRIAALGHARLKKNSAIEIHFLGAIHARPEVQRASVRVDFVLFFFAMTHAVHASGSVHSSDPSFRRNQRGHFVGIHKHRLVAALRCKFRRLAVRAGDGQQPARSKGGVQFERELSGSQSGGARYGLCGAQDVEQSCITAEVET